MNEFNNGFSAKPEDGFSAVSMDELNQIDGGEQTSMKAPGSNAIYPDVSSMPAFYDSIVRQVNRIRDRYPK